MNRRHFLQSAAVTSLVTSLTSSLQAESQPAAAPAKADNLRKSNLEARCDRTLDRVLHGSDPAYTPDFLLADILASGGRRFTNFSGDLSGRYVGALAVVAAHRGIAVPQLDALVASILSHQHGEGYFGASFDFQDPKDDDLALLWGNGRLLVGLLEYYESSRKPEVLAAAQKLGGFFLRIAPLMNSEAMRSKFAASHYATSYICWTQNTEPLALLYRITRDESWHRLAGEIAERTAYRPSEHAHGFLCSLRGIIDLYQLTGEAKYLNQVAGAWQQIVDAGNLSPTGSVPERWIPENQRTEGCGEADWIRLNLDLWRTTAEEKYLSVAERALFNEFQFNQFSTGDFGHRVFEKGGVAAAGATRAWWCCTLHGLRAFPHIEQSAFRTGKDGALYYDLPISASHNSGGLNLVAASDIENQSAVTLRIVKAAKDTPSRLRLRQPDWAESVIITVNGARPDTQPAGRYHEIRTRLQTGDLVTIQYKLRLTRETTAAGKQFVLYRGPWLLGINRHDCEAYFNDSANGNTLKAIPADSAAPDISSSSQQDSRFRVPQSHLAVEYLQGEYRLQPGKTLLRAIAEQTAIPTTDWQYNFSPEKKG